MEGVKDTPSMISDVKFVVFYSFHKGFPLTLIEREGGTI